jgi:asparagine synthase (glutamine-hydrolysing)
MYRYLAIVWNQLNVAAVRTLENCRTAAFKHPQWSVAHQGAGMLALHVDASRGAATAHILRRGTGVVLGTVFERKRTDYSAASPVQLDEAQSRRIVDSAGQHLIDNYWGSYLAILHDAKAQRNHVLRDPVGTLRCYRVSHAGVEIFFSHIQDCIELLPTMTWNINRRHLGHWMFLTSTSNDDTGLENVTRFPRGERLSVSPTGVARSVVWNPAAFAAAAENFQRPEQAARELRATVQHAVDAWTSRYSRIVHRLSGGLDSSIVAGCLARAASKPQLTFFNLAIVLEREQQRFHAPGIDSHTLAKVRALTMHGDERTFARQVAQRWNIPLVERQRDVAMDLRRLERAPPTVAPALYFTSAETDNTELELIASHGAQSFFSGLAGDSVFLATMQPLAAIDYAYTRRSTRDLWRQIRDSSALSRDSVWSVLAKTLRHGLLRRPYTSPFRLRDRPTLLVPELTQGLRVESLLDNLSQLAEQARLPPGKRNHAQGVAAAYYDFIFHAGDGADHADPLNAQPVWELALQIPTYTLLTGGISRGLARSAFSDLLPDEIRKRQVKGTGYYFYQQLVRRNRNYLRERLADGLLVRENYLDRNKLLACFALEDPSLVHTPSSLLTYLAAEIWLQQWSTANRNVTSAQPLQSAAL